MAETTALKLRRGTEAYNQNFTGAEGEPTVDTDTGRLRTHDNSTPGGVPHALQSELKQSHAAMQTAASTTNYWAKLKTWTVSTAATSAISETLQLESVGTSPGSTASITIHAECDATGNLSSANSAVSVNAIIGSVFAYNGFMLVQPSAGTVELYVQAHVASAVIGVYEIAAENDAGVTGVSYNDGATWDAATPSGSVTSAWNSWGPLSTDGTDITASGGVTATTGVTSGATLSSGPDVASTTLVAIADTASVNIAGGGWSGMLVVNDVDGGGAVAVYICGGGAVTRIGATNPARFVTGVPASGEIGVYYSAPNYVIENNTGSSRQLSAFIAETRGAA